jgi:guanylate kinase
MGEQLGSIFVISGPSGVGKGTIISQLLEAIPHLALSVSATTRLPRVGEVDGVHYHFMTDAQFEDAIAQNRFAEWCCVHGCKYGTLKADVDSRIHTGQHILVEIDVQGAQKLKKWYPQLTSIFIAPPSEAELLRRLAMRKTETEEKIQKRLVQARYELSQKEFYDYIFVNDELTQCVQDVVRLIKSKIG